MTAIEPDDVYDGRAWYLGAVDVIADPTGSVEHNNVTLRTGKSAMDAELTPAEARGLAATLLAAADYTEGNPPVIDNGLDRAFVRSALSRAAALEWQRQEKMVYQLDVTASSRRLEALHTVWSTMIEPGDQVSPWIVDRLAASERARS